MTSSKPIRMVHFADIHVGMENYGKTDPQTGLSTRVQDFLARLDEVVDYARDHEADLVLFAGDAFKTRDPDPTQQREFARRIKAMAERCPVVLLVGNHDLPGVAARATSLDIYDILGGNNIIVGNKVEGKVIQTARGNVFLGMFPYPVRNRFLTQAAFQGKSLAEIEEAFQSSVRKRVTKMAEEAAQYDMPRVFTGHFTVAEAHLGAGQPPMLGKDVPVSRSDLADSAWDYVGLGHIHAHQNLNPHGYPSIVYSGSLERIDFGEEKHEKGFCWVELHREKTTWQFIPVAARAFRTIKMDVRADSNPTEACLQTLKRKSVADAVVRLHITLRAEQVPQIQERDLLAALKDAYNVTIQKDIEQTARARLGVEHAESLTPLQLVEHYFMDKGYDSARTRQLVAIAEEVFRANGG